MPPGPIAFRTKQLLLIAGPPSSGKTTLLERMHRGDVPALCEQLGLGDPGAWTHVAATDLGRIQEPMIDRLVIHYDMLAQRTPHGFRHIPELLSGSARTVILTLMADSESLSRRTRTRLIDAVTAVFRHPLELRPRVRRVRRLWRRHRVYRSEASVRALYQRWFDLTSQYPIAAHWLFDSRVRGATAATIFDAGWSRILLDMERS